MTNAMAVSVPVFSTVAMVGTAIIGPVMALFTLATLIALALGTPPAAFLQTPSIVCLHPLRTVINLPVASPLPVAGAPVMAATIPIPEAGRPDIASAWTRNDFITRRRRRIPDDDVE